MARLQSSVAVLALRMAIAVMGSVSFGCAGCAAPARAVPVDRHVVPNALVQVSLEDFDVVSFIDIDLHTAVQTREAVESEFNTAYGKTGHPRWFFHAFDRANLDFVVARFEPKDSLRPRYVAERRLRVRRTSEAERALGVTEVVREYEIGTRGIKAGMTRREVIKVAGRPEMEQKLLTNTSTKTTSTNSSRVSPSNANVSSNAGAGAGAGAGGAAGTGAFDMRYPAFCVRFQDGKVTHVIPRGQCASKSF